MFSFAAAAPHLEFDLGGRTLLPCRNRDHGACCLN